MIFSSLLLEKINFINYENEYDLFEDAILDKNMSLSLPFLSLFPSPPPPSLCQLLGSEVHEGSYCDFILFIVVPSVMPITE